MTEKVKIKGSDIWIVVQSHAIHLPGGDAKEYFTASYHAEDPVANPSGIVFLDEHSKAVSFESPVAALEYANEKLLELV